MTLKAPIAVGMLILCCAWAAWLFGGTDWAGAQKEQIALDYTPDTAILAMSNTAAGVEKATRAYLEDAARAGANSLPPVESASPRGRQPRNLFSAHRSAGRPSSDDDLDVIYPDAGKPERAPKPSFPLDRYKLTGVMLGPDSRAFIFDAVENKSRSFRFNEKIGEGTVSAISENEVTLIGNFGSAKLRK